MTRQSPVFVGIDMVYAGVDNYKSFHGYFVGPDGIIFNKHWKMIFPFDDKDGYKRIQVWINKKPKKIHLHRLVYMVWVGEIPSGMVCCHIDNNILNNHWSNLRIDTQKNNIYDKLKNNTWQAGDSHPSAIYSDSIIEDIQHHCLNWTRKTASMLRKKYNIPNTIIYDVRRGKRKTREQRIAERLSK